MSQNTKKQNTKKKIFILPPAPECAEDNCSNKCSLKFINMKKSEMWGKTDQSTPGGSKHPYHWNLCDKCFKEEEEEGYETCPECGKFIDHYDDDKKCGEGCPIYDAGWEETAEERAEADDDEEETNDDDKKSKFLYPERCSKFWNVELQKHEWKQYLGAGHYGEPKLK